MRQMMKIGVLMPAAVLLVSGCATKDWVREQFTKSDAIVDQRFVKVEGQVDGVSTEVKGVTTQVKSLEGAVAEAKGRADAAMTKAEGVDTRLTRLWSNRYNQKTADTLEVYFGFDKAELTDGAQTALAGVVKAYQETKGLTVDGVIGAKTTLSLNTTIDERIEQIVANLERRRWLPEDLGKRYVMVNAGDYSMIFVDDGKPAFQSLVIVGTPKDPTPEIQSVMRGFQTNPYWTVPQ